MTQSWQSIPVVTCAVEKDTGVGSMACRPTSVSPAGVRASSTEGSQRHHGKKSDHMLVLIACFDKTGGFDRALEALGLRLASAVGLRLASARSLLFEWTRRSGAGHAVFLK